MARKKLGEMLVDAGVLTEQSLRMALNEQRRWGGTLGKTLIEMKVVSEADLVRVLSHQLGLESVDLDTLEIHSTVLDLVPGELAEQHSVVPFAQPMKFLDVAMADPTNLGIIDELRILTQLNIRPYLAGPKMIERALAKFYRRGFGRVLTRREADAPLDVGDAISIAPAPAGGPMHPRPGTAEIDAARRREGLPPRAPKPTRSMSFDDFPPTTGPGSGPPEIGTPRDAEIEALQERISALEALVERDEQVLRKVLALLIDKGIATREEIVERLR